MPDDKLKIDESVDAIREQATITARNLIESLEGSIKSGYMTYPELVGILEDFLLQSINEMTKIRFGLPVLFLKELGLEKLHSTLEDLEKKENIKKK